MSITHKFADDDSFQGVTYAEMIQNMETDTPSYGLYIETMAVTVTINGCYDFFKTMMEGGRIDLDTLGKSFLTCEKIPDGVKLDLCKRPSNITASINLDKDTVKQFYDMTRDFTFA